MKKLQLFVLLLGVLCVFPLQAKDYNASLFGIKSNGTTLNTTSIQKAVDWIHEQGGGRLVFYVGRYLTGTIHLKSNVTIHLNEGAVLVGSTTIYDYNMTDKDPSFIYAYDQENIGITGKGVIDGQGFDLAMMMLDQIQKGIIVDPTTYDRPTYNRPRGLTIRNCRNVTIQGINIRNTCDWVQSYDQCDGLLIDGITVDSKAYWNNDGLDIVDCKNVLVKDCFIDATDDAICLKSHSRAPGVMCENIEIRNCVARSSASGIKFGTVSAGGYKNIRIINNKVYDTYRSAFTIATPDGGIVEDVLVDSLYVYNTGNVIFLRIGKRWGGTVGSMNNITIQNVYAEVPAGKPDAGYRYEGPIEDMPRNISPASIIGLEGGYDITNVTLRNIEIVYPGGGNPNFAYRGLKPADLDAIPEMPDAYPEFSQFKELPAWGFYVRHAKNITFENVTLTAQARDYRPAIVLHEVDGVNLSGMKYNEPGGGKKQVHSYKATGVKISK